MGIYQLITPVISLAFSLTAAAFQTTISKFVGAQLEDIGSSNRNTYKPLIMGATISIPLSILIALILFLWSDQIAIGYLQEPRTAILIKLLSLTLPASAAHACINGYYYGIRKASVPACTQLLEQFFRVATVYIISSIMLNTQQIPPLWIAVVGLIIGESAGLFASLVILIHKYRADKICTFSKTSAQVTYTALLSMLIPLSANRICMNALLSIEAASLPNALRSYGLDHSTALSLYGVLTGMAFPLVFFPNALTSSVSILLLPEISANMSSNKITKIKKSIMQSIEYCSFLGIFCMGFFLLFGNMIGRLIFHSELAGYFIAQLGFLCPFLYLNTTLSGIIQGLGKTIPLFIFNLLSLLLRLGMIFFTVPTIGIKGYLWGLLFSQILLTFLCLIFLFSKKSLQK